MDTLINFVIHGKFHSTLINSPRLTGARELENHEFSLVMYKSYNT